MVPLCGVGAFPGRGCLSHLQPTRLHARMDGLMKDCPYYSLLWFWWLVLLIAGRWLFVAGCWLLVSDCWLLVAGFSLLAAAAAAAAAAVAAAALPRCAGWWNLKFKFAFDGASLFYGNPSYENSSS